MPAPEPSPSQARLLLVESARYALLRRLAFAMRHQMVVYLQPIGMVSDVMERRLRAPHPDLRQVHEAMGKIQGFSRQAVQSCLDVITWLAPEPSATVAADAAVHEVAELLRSNLSFRGFQLRAEEQPLGGQVHQGAARMVLAGSLLALTDAVRAPATVTLALTPGEDEVGIELRALPLEGDAGFGGEPPYRLLQWAEVQAMAGAESVTLTQGDDWARLALPVVGAAA